MPPKPKFTREEIIAAALELVSEKGMSALTSEIWEQGLAALPARSLLCLILWKKYRKQFVMLL